MTEGVRRVRVSGTDRVNAPLRSDGESFRYEMIYDGGQWRAYASELPILLGELIPGYANLATDADRLHSRVQHSVGMQVRLQAVVNLSPRLSECTSDQIAVLMGSRDLPPTVERWEAPVPLVLVSTYYDPHTPEPRPSTEPPGEIIWLDPSDDTNYLLSLDAADVIVLAENESLATS
jgi:hypothetical protein